jgi:hypothetical protein
LRLPSQAAADSPKVEETAEQQEQDLDFILLFGNPDTARQLAVTAKYGVWYFAHGDPERFSSDAPGFWEIYYNHAVTGVTLLKLDESGAGVVLKSGYFATIRDSFAENIDLALSEAAGWPLQICRDLIRGTVRYFDGAPAEQPPVHYGIPSALQVAVMRILEKTNAAARYFRIHLFSIDWNVFRLRGTPADFIGADAPADVRSLCKHTKNSFLADPCVVTQNGQAYIFCEEYAAHADRGRIAAIELKHGIAASKPRAVIVEPYHLSFPQLFQHGGSFYCMAETAGVQTLDLYRAIEFPYRWTKVHTLMRNVRAVDTTLLHFNDKWWLFCTSGKGPRQGDYSHLHIWFADDLFGSWTPHARNPVKIDARSSRPAGAFFTHDGQLYRPTQDCSRTYGGAIRINRIDKLSETEFEETVVGRIRPPRGAYNRGIHTLSCADEWCIVDAKRYVFNPSGIVAVCKDAAKVLIRTARRSYVTKPAG